MDTQRAQHGNKPTYPIPRRAHKKSKTGCRNCRERRVKCDEKRPVCNKCSVHYKNIQQCDYDRLQPTSPGGSSLPVTEEGACLTRIGNDDGVTQTSLDLIQLPSPKSPSPSSLDPFATHPLSKEPHIDQLMHAYFTAQIFNVFPYYPTKRLNPVLKYFAPLIWKDPVLFHVTLLLSAFQLETASHSKDRTQSARLHRDCLQLLQYRINEPFPGCVSDETLAAVAGLVTLEHERGNPRLAATHMSGMKRILELRGGMSEVRRSNPAVANVLFCAFIATADEAFPPQDQERPVTRPAWFYRALQNEPSDSCIDFEAHGVGPAHAQLMVNVRMLAKTYQTAEDCSTVQEYQDVLTFLCSTLQRLLVLPLPEPIFSYAAHITAACRHALVVHVFAQWCAHQPDPSLMVSLAQHNLLAALRPILGNGVSNQLILWLLAVGGTGLFGQAQRKWFVSQLVEVTNDMGITSWEVMRENLKKVIWHAHQDEKQHRELWDEVAERRAWRCP